MRESELHMDFVSFQSLNILLSLNPLYFFWWIIVLPVLRLNLGDSNEICLWSSALDHLGNQPILLVIVLYKKAWQGKVMFWNLRPTFWLIHKWIQYLRLVRCSWLVLDFSNVKDYHKIFFAFQADRCLCFRLSLPHDPPARIPGWPTWICSRVGENLPRQLVEKFSIHHKLWVDIRWRSSWGCKCFRNCF